LVVVPVVGRRACHRWYDELQQPLESAPAFASRHQCPTESWPTKCGVADVDSRKCRTAMSGDVAARACEPRPQYRWWAPQYQQHHRAICSARRVFVALVAALAFGDWTDPATSPWCSWAMTRTAARCFGALGCSARGRLASRVSSTPRRLGRCQSRRRRRRRRRPRRTSRIPTPSTSRSVPARRRWWYWMAGSSARSASMAATVTESTTRHYSHRERCGGAPCRCVQSSMEMRRATRRLQC
jgi:hypothetical protein